MDLEVLLGRSDVDPVPLVDEGLDVIPASEQSREEAPLDGVLHSRWDQLEGSGLENVDASVDLVRGDLSGIGLFDEALDPSLLVGLDEPIGGRVGNGGQDDGRGCPRGPVPGDHSGEIDVRQDVSVEHDSGGVEVGLGILDGAPGAQGRVLHGVVESRARAVSRAEDRSDLVGLVGDREHHLADAHLRQEVELVAQEGAVHDGHHGFWGRQGQGPEAGSLAPHEDDGPHRSALIGRGS